MKLTKSQLRNLVEEVILENRAESTLLAEECLLTEEQEVLMEGAMQSVAAKVRETKSEIARQMNIAKNSQLSKKLEGLLTQIEEVTPEERSDMIAEVKSQLAPVFKDLVYMFREYESRVSAASAKLETKMKSSMIDPLLLRRMSEIWSSASETGGPEETEVTPDVEKEMAARFAAEEEAEGAGAGGAGALQEQGGPRMGHLEELAMTASTELSNFVVLHESYMDTLDKLAGSDATGLGGIFRELSYGADPETAPSEEAHTAGVGGMGAASPEQPTKVAPRGPKGGMDIGQTRQAFGTAPGAALESIQRKSKVFTLSETKLKRLIRNELKNNK